MLDFHPRFAAAIAGACDGPLAVYRNTVLAGAGEALAANFPVVRAMLGDTMFDAAAVDFAEARPPASPVLALYGEAFPDWIEEQPWAREVPYLSDVARVERLHFQALFAADAEPLSPAELGRLGPRDWTRVRLLPHPATRYAVSRWPAASLWLAHQHADSDPAGVEWRREALLVTRPFDRVGVETIAPSTHRLLIALASGATIAAAVDATLAAFPGADIAACFTLLLNRGAFAAILR